MSHSPSVQRVTRGHALVYNDSNQHFLPRFFEFWFPLVYNVANGALLISCLEKRELELQMNLRTAILRYEALQRWLRQEQHACLQMRHEVPQKEGGSL